MWRSLVSRLNGVQEAPSSNLGTRTMKTAYFERNKRFFCIYPLFFFGIGYVHLPPLISKEMSGSFLFSLADLRKKDDFASVVAWLTGTASVFWGRGEGRRWNAGKIIALSERAIWENVT